MSGERDRISLLLEQDLSRDNRQRLDSLFEADEYLSRVSALRKEPKDFRLPGNAPRSPTPPNVRAAA